MIRGIDMYIDGFWKREKKRDRKRERERLVSNIV